MSSDPSSSFGQRNKESLRNNTRTPRPYTNTPGVGRARGGPETDLPLRCVINLIENPSGYRHLLPPYSLLYSSQISKIDRSAKLFGTSQLEAHSFHQQRSQAFEAASTEENRDLAMMCFVSVVEGFCRLGPSRWMLRPSRWSKRTCLRSGPRPRMLKVDGVARWC